MVTRTEYEVLFERISRLTEGMEDIQQALLRSKPRDGKCSEEAWSNLMGLSEEISAKWQVPSAVEEIRAQRSKGY